MLTASARSHGSRAPGSRRTRRSARPGRVGAVPRVQRRARIAGALGRASHDQLMILALILVERLSAAEAASVLDLPVRRVREYYRNMLADLRHAAIGRDSALRRVRRGRAAQSLRKAS